MIASPLPFLPCRFPAAARARHARRALEQAAEHGVALLEALRLPRLTAPGLDAIDPGEIGDAVERAIAALDEADAPGEDLEDEGHDEPALGWCERVDHSYTEDGRGEDEETLGWTAAVRQIDLGSNTADGEHTLGAPERHPFVLTMTARLFEPADGQGVCRRRRDESQTPWAQGARRDGEGEAEPGYDLPEGDDERCASEHDGREPSLGSSDHLDQERWADGNDSGGDCELDPVDASAPWTAEQRVERQRGRQIGTELRGRAEAIRRRARPSTIRPSGNLIPVDAGIFNALLPHRPWSPL